MQCTLQSYAFLPKYQNYSPLIAGIQAFFCIFAADKQQQQMKKKAFLFSVMALISACVVAQTPILGEWVTVDDATGEQWSVVTIYQGTNGLYYGDITDILYQTNDPEQLICTQCKGEDHRKPFRGLTIIRDMKLVDGELRGGHVLDPNNGKFYYGKIYLNKEGNLVLRGSLDKAGILGRSQTWLRNK